MIESEKGASEARLQPRDRYLLVGCVVLAAVCLWIGFALYPRVNPEASIRFKVDRSTSEPVAVEFLQRAGVSVEAHRHAVGFTYDDPSKVFLERTLGGEASNALMSDTVRMWRWGHRWFRPLQKEEVRIEIATTGQVAAFEHEIEETAAGADLSLDDARALAERFLTETLGQPLARLEMLDARSERRPHRSDHTFTWRVRDLRYGEGDYRYEVAIHGDQPGSYREFVHVPEKWARDYKALRSKNETSGAVAASLLLLTLVAAIVVLAIRMRWADVRWRTAGTFGGIGVVLSFLVGLNSLPVSLYESYQTTESFGGFLITQIFSSLAQGFLIGALIAVLSGAGEALYREAYPEKLSLTQFFSRRGLRTRRFLLSTVLGLTLTAFFFAYQEVFYAAAQSFGAWAPLEVPYSDLLGTWFPWVFVLLVGFLPAVSEEFLSRMFSIPFVKKYTGSTLLALVVPALIWGFAHSNYPNQPFYIRGFEVGLAGVLIGMVMLRVNIGTALIWHYTVDALYTSILLFRSGNTYYILSAAAASLVILLPLGYAIVSYLRSGRFLEPAGLLNSDEGPAVRPIETGPPEPAPALPAVRSSMRRPWAIGLAVLGLGLAFLPGPRIEDARRISIDRDEARARTDLLLRQLGETPDSFQCSVTSDDGLTSGFARYALSHGGAECLQTELTRYDALFRWRARYYRPLSAHEVVLELDSEDGSLVRVERRVAEQDSMPSLDSGAAVALAKQFAQAHGIELEGLELRESSVENRPHRLDHTFVWQSTDDDPTNVGEARHRVRIVVQGDQIGSLQRVFKLPEDWERAREKRTALWAIRLVLRIGVIGSLIGMLLWHLIVAQKSGAVRWGRAALVSIPFGLLALAASANSWPQFIDRYETSFPWMVYLITALVGIAVGMLVSYLLSLVAVGLVTTLYPESWGLRAGWFRRGLLRDALLAAGCALLVALGVDRLQNFLLGILPQTASPPSFASLGGLRSIVPWFEVVSRVFRTTLFETALLAGGVALLRQRRESPRATAGFIALLLLALVPLGAQGGGEMLHGFAGNLIELAALLAVVRFVLGSNYLAYPLAIFVVTAVREVVPYLGAESAWVRTQGFWSLAFLLLPIVWLVARSMSGAPRRA